MSLFQGIYLSVHDKCRLFDCLVASVLNYGSEVWGFHAGKDIENVHSKFCRYILCVKKSSNLDALHGEIGRLPLQIFRKLRILNYWIKILKNNNSLLNQIYIMQYNDVCNGRANIRNNWAAQVKNILDELGFSDVWINQHTILPHIMYLKQRLFDQYKQTWYSNVSQSSKLEYYVLFKNVLHLEPEKYLCHIKDARFKVALSKFRISAHNLEIERGRYIGISKDQRVCKCCNARSIESEFHFLLVCPFYSDLRKNVST